MKEMILAFVLVALATSSQIIGQESLAVTIYNNDFAMVKDVRTIKFDKGQSTLYFTDVSSNIQTQTVTFKALKNPNSIRVYEQNFQQNLIDRHSILKKYIQKNIEIVAQFGDQPRRISGVLLSQDGNFILKTSTGIISLKNVPAIQLPSIPDGFFTLPTLNWKVFSQSAQTTSCEVAYRTTGFGWSADYSITLNSDQTKGDVGGWVTIDNNSGKKYQNAKLKLIAGEVNVVKPPQPQYQYEMMPMMMMADSAPMTRAAPPQFVQKSFADYHLYTLSVPVTLNQSSQKQVQFVPRVYDVNIRKFNKISVSVGGNDQRNIKVQSVVQFNNSKQQRLGIPLPKGTIRIFKQDDSDGSLQFIGEDSIKHTPKNENITLTIGNAFDVVANLYTTKKTSDSNGGYFADMNLTIVNHKQIDAEIEVLVNSYWGDNLKIKWSQENVAKFVRQNVSLYKIIFRIKADQTIVLKWTEDYRP